MVGDSLDTVEEINRVISNYKNVVVVIRFGDLEDPLCLLYDDLLNKIKNKIRRFVKIFTCEKSEVPEVVEGLDLYNPACIMCFYNCKLIKIDLSRGPKDRIDVPVDDENDLVEIFTKVYECGSKGKSLIYYPMPDLDWIKRYSV